MIYPLILLKTNPEGHSKLFCILCPNHFGLIHRNQASASVPFLSFAPVSYLVLQGHQSEWGWGPTCAAISSAQGPLTVGRGLPRDGQEILVSIIVNFIKNFLWAQFIIIPYS